MKKKYNIHLYPSQEFSYEREEGELIILDDQIKISVRKFPSFLINPLFGLAVVIILFLVMYVFKNIFLGVIFFLILLALFVKATFTIIKGKKIIGINIKEIESLSSQKLEIPKDVTPQPIGELRLKVINIKTKDRNFWIVPLRRVFGVYLRDNMKEVQEILDYIGMKRK